MAAVNVLGSALLSALLVFSLGASAVVAAETTRQLRPRVQPATPRLPGSDLVLRAAAQRELPGSVSSDDLSGVVAHLRAGDTNRAQARWGEFVTGLATGGMPTDINAVVQWVLRESYLETNQDLKLHADKVRFFNEQKQALRDRISEISTQARTRSSLRVSVVTRRSFAPGAEPLAVRRPQTLTREQIRKYLAKLEAQLASAGDDAQLANIDLQNALQKQQQTLQMMSNMAKVLHDTAMAIIRKIGG